MRITVMGTSAAQVVAVSMLRDLPGVEVVAPGQAVDAALIHAPAAERRALIEQAAALTGWILCDVPFATAPAEARAIAAACAAQGVLLCPAFRLRWLPIVQSLAGALPDLRTPLSVRLEYQAAQASDNSRLDDMLVAAVDLVGWLFDTTIESAHVERHLAQRQVIVSAGLANGAYALLDVGLGLFAPHPAAETLKLEVIGTGGTARIDSDAGTIRLSTAAEVRHLAWNGDPLAALLRAFIGRVEAGDRLNDDGLRAYEQVWRWLYA